VPGSSPDTALLRFPARSARSTSTTAPSCATRPWPYWPVRLLALVSRITTSVRVSRVPASRAQAPVSVFRSKKARRTVARAPVETSSPTP